MFNLNKVKKKINLLFNSVFKFLLASNIKIFYKTENSNYIKFGR